MSDDPKPPPGCFAYGWFHGRALRCNREAGHDGDHGHVVKWTDDEAIDPSTEAPREESQAGSPQQQPRKPKAPRPQAAVQQVQAPEPDEIDQAIAAAAAEDPDDDGLIEDEPEAEELDLSAVNPKDLTPQMLRALAEQKEQESHPARCFSCKHKWHFGACPAPLTHNGQPTEEACGCATAVA